MKKIYLIHLYYGLLVAFLLLIVFYPFFYLFTRSPKTYFLANKSRLLWSYFFLYFIGTIPLVKGRHHLKPKQNYIFCFNHASYLDIPIATVVASSNYCFLGKIELLKNPFCSVFFKTIDVPVDRSSRIKSARSVAQCVKKIKEKLSLIVFPEGTIPPENPPHMVPFKEGAAVLAVKTKTPIVPVTFVNNWRLMHNKGSQTGLNWGIAKIIIHEPLYVDETNDEEKEIKRLNETTFDVIQSRLEPLLSQ